MKKHYFYGMETKGDKITISRFRDLGTANAFVSVSRTREVIPSTHPELRRINRRIAAGEQITWPVEIE